MNEVGAATVEIRIPSALRRYSDGAARTTVTAATVLEALQALVRTYPELRGMILDEQNVLRRHVNVFCETAEVRSLSGLATPLQSGQTLMILPAVSGG